MDWRNHLKYGIIHQTFCYLIMVLFTRNLFVTSVQDFSIFLGVAMVSPLLPDMDHRIGKLREILLGLGLVSTLYFLYKGFALYSLAGIIFLNFLYFSIYFTKHRGMWHHPASSLIWGILLFLATYNFAITIVGVMGYLSHLLMDINHHKRKKVFNN